MRRWKQFNQRSHREQGLEEQDVGIYTYQLLERIEHSPVFGCLIEAAEEMDLMELYHQIKEWLQEEVPS